jgi:hypothetical protein
MTIGARLWLSLVSIVLPGEAHGQIERQRPALAWALAATVSLLVAPLTICSRRSRCASPAR